MPASSAGGSSQHLPKGLKETAEGSALPCQAHGHSWSSLTAPAQTPGYNSTTDRSHSHLGLPHTQVHQARPMFHTQEGKQAQSQAPGPVLSAEADFYSLF